MNKNTNIWYSLLLFKIFACWRKVTVEIFNFLGRITEAWTDFYSSKIHWEQAKAYQIIWGTNSSRSFTFWLKIKFPSMVSYLSTPDSLVFKRSFLFASIELAPRPGLPLVRELTLRMCTQSSSTCQYPTNYCLFPPHCEPLRAVVEGESGGN